jgi:hypothetical protein
MLVHHILLLTVVFFSNLFHFMQNCQKIQVIRFVRPSYIVINVTIRSGIDIKEIITTTKENAKKLEKKLYV